MIRRERRDYTDEFKEQIVKLYQNGKRKADLIREYELMSTTEQKCKKIAFKFCSFMAKK